MNFKPMKLFIKLFDIVFIILTVTILVLLLENDIVEGTYMRYAFMPLYLAYFIGKIIGRKAALNGIPVDLRIQND